jgi:hypothetical protein
MSNDNRTFVCSVAFIDIVEYSKKSVAEQMRTKEQFNLLLAQALADVPTKDRIILDTGDGAAISFLGDPEDGLFLGLTLRDALAERSDETLRLRTGINLGPVRLVKDINGQPNIIGDGINVAQRVMSFAAINQVLASRSYYEVISVLSPDYAHLFSFEGARTDKHVREHEVYALGKEPAPPRPARRKPGAAAVHATAVLEKLSHTASTTRAQVMRRPLLATGMAVALILILAATLRVTLRSADIYAAPDVTTQKTPIRPSQAAKKAQAAPAPVAEAESAPPPKARAAKKAPVTDAATGTVRLSISPWGEIHVNGTKYGVAPPLRDVALKPGSYKIEVRNPGFASYVQVIEVKSGEEIRIRHQFH